MVDYASDYWARLPAEELAKRCLDFINRENLTNPMRELWQRSYEAYYANALRGDGTSALNFFGKKGEIIQTSMNEARSTGEQVCSIVTKNRLAFEPATLSSESVDLDDARIAKALGAYVVREEKLDLKQESMAETALLMGAVFTLALWRPELGEEVMDPKRGVMVRTGKAEVSILKPTGLWFDWRKGDWAEVEWVIFRVRRNRYSEMQLRTQGMEGERAQAIVEALASAPNIREDELLWRHEAQGTPVSGREVSEGEFGDESIYTYWFVHVPSTAIPEGRILIFTREGKLVSDGGNEYGEIPLEPCIPKGFQNDTLWGYPRFLDVLPAQESLDTVWSSVVTNLSALGIQSVQAPEGSNVTAKDIGGLQFFYYKQTIPGGPPQKIEPLQLCQNAPDAWKAIEGLKTETVELSGLNGALRGTPPPGVDAGIAIATLSANALEFLQPFTRALVTCMDGTMTRVVKIYSRFAVVPQQIPVETDENKEEVLSFIGEKLRRVRRMSMQMTNPLFLTLAGKVMISKELLGANLIRSRSEYLSMLETGSYEQMIDDALDETRLINQENQMLREGKTPMVCNTDRHADHIISHKKVIDDPRIRILANTYRDPKAAPPEFQGDPIRMQAWAMAAQKQNTDEVERAYAIVEAVLEHIAKHDEAVATASPTLLAICDTGSMPMLAPPPEAPPPQGGAGAPQGAPQGGQ